MIYLLTGPDRYKEALAWAQKKNACVWFGYEDPEEPPGVNPFRNVPYEALATFAQRCRRPHEATNRLWLGNLDSLRHGVSATRNPAPADFNGAERLMTVCKTIAASKCPFDGVVVSGISRLYDQMMARIGRGLGDPEAQAKVLEYGRALAAEALCRLACDLRDAQLDVVLTSSEVVVGERVLPNVPGALRSLAKEAL